MSRKSLSRKSLSFIDPARASDLAAIPAASPAGTLVWVGQWETPEFVAAYRFCSQRASQFAFRKDLRDYRQRRAAEARVLIVACQSNQMDLSPLIDRDESHAGPIAKFLLMGSQCAGQRPHIADEFPGTSFYWHRWNQFLPFQLTCCGVSLLPSKNPPRSVAVVASQFASADPLMELASRFGAAVVWCRSGQSHQGHNFDAVWWDDSVARAGTTRQWQERISAMRSPRAQHVWITGTPTTTAIADARAAGVSCVLSKPFRLEPLEQIMGAGNSADASPSATRRAA